MKRIKNLVTGGSGFIGSHLCKKLLEKGEEVICLDNFLTSEEQTIETLITNFNFKLINQDVTKNINCQVDNIWHLACPASPNDYQRNPIETSKTIFLGTYNMLELARKYNSKLLLASSSEVYGNAKENPQKESYTGSVKTTGLRSCYEEGKRIAETLCADFQRVHSVDIRIARIFNTYGPNMRVKDGRVISNFITQALKSEALTIYGDGKQTRSFCYVDDLIEGMISLMESKYQEPINIGNPEELVIKDLAVLINKLTNNVNGIVFKPLPQDDPRQRKPSIDVANKFLKWKPKTELINGLKKTITWFQNNQ